MTEQDRSVLKLAVDRGKRLELQKVYGKRWRSILEQIEADMEDKPQ